MTNETPETTRRTPAADPMRPTVVRIARSGSMTM